MGIPSNAGPATRVLHATRVLVVVLDAVTDQGGFEHIEA